MNESTHNRRDGQILGKRRAGSPPDDSHFATERRDRRVRASYDHWTHGTDKSLSDAFDSTGNARRPSHREDFEIAIICALPLEYDAVCLVFDEFWDEDGEAYGRASGDYNTYTTGRIGKHNVVLVLLHRMGKATAAGAAASMRLSYTGLRIAFLVGICGGVPSPQQGDEIIMGDVVISKQIIQYDFGRQYPGHFVRKNAVEDNLGMPSKDVRSMMVLLETKRGRDRLRKGTATCLQHLQDNARRQEMGDRYTYPGTGEDKLFDAEYRHKHRGRCQCICGENFGLLEPVCPEAVESSCEDLGCEEAYILPRARLHRSRCRESLDIHPAIHTGPVASGDTVMKSGRDRDRIAAMDKVVAFEMEGAGVWEEVPSVVVKGVCDYADCHKQKKWQNYAAAAAAAAARSLLYLWIYDDARRSERNKILGAATTTADAAFRVEVRDNYVLVTLEEGGQITHAIPLSSNQPKLQPSFHRVTVIDARGIPLPFYMETLFTHILKERFEDLGHGKIDRDEWLLEDRGTGEVLDLSAPWHSLFKPNQVLFMSMIFRRRTTPSTTCPSCSFANAGPADKEVQCKRCGLIYQRVEDIQKYEVLEGEEPANPAPVKAPVSTGMAGPERFQHQIMDDIRQYRRVQVIDTSFQIDKAGNHSSRSNRRILLTAQDLQETDFLARRLAQVSGLSVADCLTILKDSELTLSSILGELTPPVDEEQVGHGTVDLGTRTQGLAMSIPGLKVRDMTHDIAQTADEMLGVDAGEGPGATFGLQHGRFVSSAAEVHAHNTLKKLDPIRGMRNPAPDRE
ncbi:Casein kinase II subunit beta-2 [Purpureocillium lavendulum]|uniref:Casein kinase II subunit beta-2 n=1 Tax=Purpureocillium lavendulum TaxID=1247861 RepID=A0AB34G1U6_9HYPO|nr:Casein kinase II subunit beta-2 [Purpureocillium lavendulum]